jgi:arginine N-succinyltransferase
MFRVRNVESKDLDDLFLLSKQANFLNLPQDRTELTQMIQLSHASFREKGRELADSHYVFVLEDVEKGRVVGSASVIAQHGAPEDPHTFFKVTEKKRVSKSLHIGFLHQVLRMGFDFNGPTEIGGLVLLPEYRGHAEKLGKFLSFVRFIFIAARPGSFKEELLSELMPPFNDRGESPIWESIGRKFTNLSYDEADKLSRKNMEFVTSLFPEGDIYTTMLPAEARAAIGNVGEDTEPVKKMLEKIGFKYKEMIDPFDGGPHFWANVNDVTLIQQTRAIKLADAPAEDFNKERGIVLSIGERTVSALQGEFSVSQSSVVLNDSQKTDLNTKTEPELYYLPL